MQTSLIVPMVRALRRVFRKMLASDAAVLNPTVLRSWRADSGSIETVVPVEGRQQGALVLSATGATVDALAREMYGHSGELPTPAQRESAMRDLARMFVNTARRDERVSGVNLLSPHARAPQPADDLTAQLSPWVTIPIHTAVGLVLLGVSFREGAPAAPMPASTDAGAALEEVA